MAGKNRVPARPIAADLCVRLRLYRGHRVGGVRSLWFRGVCGSPINFQFEPPSRMLGFFSIYMLYWAFEKYAVPLLFGAESTGDTLGSAYGVAWTIALVGISYIGFKFIHFFVDYRSGDIEHVEPLGFLSWLLFFPSIVARPMQRYQDWNDQFGVTGLTFDHAAWGLQRILFG